MKRTLALLSALLLLPCLLGLALPARTFEPATPESAGVASGAILDWLDAVERDVDALHGFVLLRHGKAVAEGYWAPYEAGRPHMLYSLSKSFASTAIGIAADEGKLSLDAPVLSFFPDKAPAAPSANLAAMRVRDLLCMGTGNHNDTFAPMKKEPDGDWVRVFFAQPVEHAPGTFFRYNTGASYMLSAVLHKATGQHLLDYLTPRLFAPLGIEGATWERCPQGLHTGGYGLKVTTRDIAALGQLYLQHGAWQGRSLLSTQWVAQATSRQIDNGSNPESDWNQGYGFQFWRCRHNAYRGDGAFGQYCIVMPDQNAVLAINSGLGNMQQVLDLVWTRLLPAMRPEPLPADPATQARLAARLAALALPPVQGAPDAPLAARVLGKTYRLDDNDKGLLSLSLSRDGFGTFLTLTNAHGEQRLPCGHGRWQRSLLTFEKELRRPIDETNGRQPVASSGAWTAPDTFTVQTYFCETPFRLTLTLHFGASGDLTADAEYNVSFGPKKWRFTGRAQ